MTITHDDMLKICITFQRKVGQARAHIESIIARECRVIDRIDPGPTIHIFNANPTEHQIITSLTVVDTSISISNDRVIIGTTIEGVSTSTTNESIAASSATDQISTITTIDAVVATTAIEGVLATPPFNRVISKRRKPADHPWAQKPRSDRVAASSASDECHCFKESQSFN